MATQGIVTTLTSGENWNLMGVKSGGCLLWPSFSLVLPLRRGSFFSQKKFKRNPNL